MEHYLNIFLKYYMIWIIVWFLIFQYAYRTRTWGPALYPVSTIFLFIANIYGNVDVRIGIIGGVLFIISGTVSFGILLGRTK